MKKVITHTNATFNKIPSGIFNKITKITSSLKNNAQMIIDNKHQVHAKALTKAGVAPKIYLTLNEIWKKADASKLSNDAKREKISGGRGCNTYFYIGFSKIFQEDIYNMVSKTS